MKWWFLVFGGPEMSLSSFKPGVKGKHIFGFLLL